MSALAENIITAADIPAEAGGVIYVEFTRVYVNPNQAEEEKDRVRLV